MQYFLMNFGIVFFIDFINFVTRLNFLLDFINFGTHLLFYLYI